MEDNLDLSDNVFGPITYKDLSFYINRMIAREPTKIPSIDEGHLQRFYSEILQKVAIQGYTPSVKFSIGRDIGELARYALERNEINHKEYDNGLVLAKVKILLGDGPLATDTSAYFFRKKGDTGVIFMDRAPAQKGIPFDLVQILESDQEEIFSNDSNIRVTKSKEYDGTRILNSILGGHLLNNERYNEETDQEILHPFLVAYCGTPESAEGLIQFGLEFVHGVSRSTGHHPRVRIPKQKDLPEEGSVIKYGTSVGVDSNTGLFLDVSSNSLGYSKSLGVFAVDGKHDLDPITVIKHLNRPDVIEALKKGRELYLEQKK